MVRRALTLSDRADIAVGLKAGWTDRRIGAYLGRDHSIVWRERPRNSRKTRGYRPVIADVTAQKRRSRVQTRKIDDNPVLEARVRADLKRSRTRRQIAGRLQLEASDPSVEAITKSPDAEGATVSHEAVYRWIYVLPKSELAKAGILLQSKRTNRKTRKSLGERKVPRRLGCLHQQAPRRSR